MPQKFILQGRGRPRKMSRATTLSDLGLTRQEAHEFRLLASIPDDQFEALLANGVSRTQILNVARQLRNPDYSESKLLPDELIERLEAFTERHGFRSRREAVQYLLDWALTRAGL